MTLSVSKGTVFVAGNFEAQRLACYCMRFRPTQREGFARTVRDHFIYSCLLSDRVVQPNAHFYQSEVTRWLTREYKLLFRPFRENPPVASYGLSYRKSSYAEDSREKAASYLGDFPCYHDSVIRSRLTDELDSLVEPQVRFGDLAVSLSDLLINEAQRGGQLFAFVGSVSKSYEDTERILMPLKHIAEERQYALIPEYLSTKTPTGLPPYYSYLMRLTLLRCYMQIAEHLYNATAQNALYPYYSGVVLPYQLHFSDTQLFSYFMGLIPDTKEIIRNLSDKDILELKLSSDSFQYFVQYYRAFVESLGNASLDECKNSLVRELQSQKQLYQTRIDGVLKNQILAGMMCSSIDETAKNRQRVLPRTKDIFSYREIPIYSLVAEVMERFAGKYERTLETNLRIWHHGTRQLGNKTSMLFLPGISYQRTPGLQEFLKAKGEIIGRLARRFVHYDHPEGRVIDEQAIARFLCQFATAERASLALTLLENVDFIDRNRMTEMFRHYCTAFLKTEDTAKIVLTNLGGPYDSSRLVSYFLGDVGMELQLRSADLRAILDKSDPVGTIILFVDDNIGSAKQAVDTFRDLMGLPAEKELEEMHELELTSQQADKLKEYEIRLFTFVGFEEGKAKFVKTLRNLGLNVTEAYSFMKTEEKIGCFHPASVMFDTSERREACRAMCSEIGIALFSDKTAWSEQTKEERSLGYGSSQKLIVFSYNVPTSTLPILWKAGTFAQVRWQPLFPRRHKR